MKEKSFAWMRMFEEERDDKEQQMTKIEKGEEMEIFNKTRKHMRQEHIGVQEEGKRKKEEEKV